MSLAQLVDRLQHRGQVINVATVAANDTAPVALQVVPAPVAVFDSGAAPGNQVNWRELDAAYLAHHGNCNTCIAAGRGIHYGLRCGVGSSLWALYSDAIKQPTM